MAITPGVIVAAAVEELPKIFNDAVENERRGQPDYIANGAPESIVGKIAQATSRAACRNYGAQSASVQAEAAGQYERACRPYLDSIDPGNGAGIAVPFDGGQCDALYIVSYAGTTSNGAGAYNARAKTWGPLGGGRSVDRGDGRFNVEILSAGELIATQLCSGSAPSKGPYQYRQANSSAGIAGTDDGGTFTILQACAGADDCGNPPPVVAPPTDQPDPIGRPFRFNPSPDVDIDIDVTIGPTGDITVDFGTGPITIDPFGGGDGGDGGGGGGGGAPTAGDPGDSQDTGGGGGGGGGGGDTGGDAPPGKVLTGVKVEILQAPLSRRRFTDEVDRGVGYVYMGTPTEGLGLDPTGATVRSGQFFFAQKDYLTRWAVRANFGYNLRTTPYYKDAPE